MQLKNNSEQQQQEYDIKANNAKNEIRRGSGYLTLSEIRDILFQYCTKHNLIHETNKNIIELNDVLKYVLYESNKSLKSQKLKIEKTTITKKDIIELWKKCLSQGYAIVVLPTNDIVRMNRGNKPPTIKIQVEKRSNKKYLTKVYGIEEYNINPTLFAQDISKRFACSCTTNSLPSSNNKHEIVIQGNLADDIQYLLTCGMEGKTMHGNALNKFSSNDFVLRYDEFVIPKGICDLCLKKGVIAKSHKKK